MGVFDADPSRGEGFQKKPPRPSAESCRATVRGGAACGENEVARFAREAEMYQRGRGEGLKWGGWAGWQKRGGMGVALGFVVRRSEHFVVRSMGLCWGAGMWFVFAGLGVLGCQVPVFRYALEQWAPSAYRVVVHLPANGSDAVAERALSALEGARQAPVRVKRVPSEGPARFEAFFPSARRDRVGRRAWVSDLNISEVDAFLSSPARGELGKRLFSGQTAVWLFLESGDRERDAAAEAVLGEALAAARGKLKLPEAVPGEVSERPGLMHLPSPRIDFSVLKLSRKAAEERAFIGMLTALEEGLESRSREPMVFPVFGRGRALEPLIGRGITVDNILEYGAYLCGPCSCEVKEQNPGIDLLLAIDWEPVDRAPRVEIVRIDARGVGHPTAERSGSSRSVWDLIFVLGGGIAVVAAVVSEGMGSKK